MFIQLRPEIPLDVVDGESPLGSGRAIGVIDYSPSDDLLWVVAMDESGQIWTVNNRHVRLNRNISLGRRIPHASPHPTSDQDAP